MFSHLDSISALGMGKALLQKFHNWGQCPRTLEKVGTFEKKAGTLWEK